MPLIKEHGEVDEVIDGDVYVLKRWLGWWDMARASETKGITIHVRGRDINSGRIGQFDPDELVPVTMDASEDAMLRKLRIWLLRWSHAEPITESNLKLIPPRHFARLVRRIRQLESDQEQAITETTTDSPLADSSNDSSEA